MPVYFFGNDFDTWGLKKGPQLIAAEPAEEVRWTWGPTEAAAEAVARCRPAGRAAKSAAPGVSAWSAAAPPRGPCRGREQLRGPD